MNGNGIGKARRAPRAEPRGASPRATAGRQRGPLLSPRLGFVVQFRSGAGIDADFSGRVEHLVSWRVEHFESPRQLVDFLIRVLAETQRT